uniref:RRM domain-containing protein n=1 Tax=Trichogramma kaykai TaxID=54128 RepID=A0ABD2VVJ0_9HYME
MEGQESRSNQHTSDIAQIRDEVTEVQGSLQSILTSRQLGPSVPQASPHLSDTCEILLTGLPGDVDLSEEEVLGRVFTAMGLKHYHKFVAHTRPREPKNSRGTTPANTKAFVFALSSQSTRDHCVKSSFKLASIGVNTLFGVGDGTIRLRPLWPCEVFNLLNKAYEAAHKLNYAQPIVKNLTVFMRETLGAKLIPIQTERDLQSLKPRQK